MLFRLATWNPTPNRSTPPRSRFGSNIYSDATFATIAEIDPSRSGGFGSALVARCTSRYSQPTLATIEGLERTNRCTGSTLGYPT